MSRQKAELWQICWHLAIQLADSIVYLQYTRAPIVSAQFGCVREPPICWSTIKVVKLLIGVELYRTSGKVYLSGHWSQILLLYIIKVLEWLDKRSLWMNFVAQTYWPSELDTTVTPFPSEKKRLMVRNDSIPCILRKYF